MCTYYWFQTIALELVNQVVIIVESSLIDPMYVAGWQNSWPWNGEPIEVHLKAISVFLKVCCWKAPLWKQLWTENIAKGRRKAGTVKSVETSIVMQLISKHITVAVNQQSRIEQVVSAVLVTQLWGKHTSATIGELLGDSVFCVGHTEIIRV
jgi:hypothetical protein